MCHSSRRYLNLFLFVDRDLIMWELMVQLYSCKIYTFLIHCKAKTGL